MSLESFYGGKQGLSSIIKKAFKYISKEDPAYQALSDSEKRNAENNNEVMEVAFQKPDFKEVWYGELCIINTVNKNNPANGCLFRRTLTKKGSSYPINLYNVNSTLISADNPQLSAEYIGQIVGPQSGTPYVSIGSLDSVDAAAASDTDAYATRVYEKTKIVDDQEIPEKIYNEKLEDTSEIDTYTHDAIEENIFKQGSADGLDTIQYNWCNIRNNGEDSWIYLGFAIPYFYADFQYETVDYYTNPTRNNLYPNRKFYQKWNIQVPRGVRGNSAQNIRLTTLKNETDNENSVYQSFDVLVKDETKDLYSFNLNANKVDKEFLAKNIGDNSETPDDKYNEVPFYVCDFYIFNPYYINENNENIGDKNNQGQKATIYLGTPKNIDDFKLIEDGSITILYTDGSQKTLDEKIKWIKDIQFSRIGQWKSTPPSEEDLNRPEAGYLRVIYNTIDEDDDNNYKDFLLGLPQNFSLVGDINGSNANDSRKLTVEYQTNNRFVPEKKLIGDPINYVQDIIVKDGHWLVLFNDPEHRKPTLKEDQNSYSRGTKDANGIRWYDSFYDSNDSSNNDPIFDSRGIDYGSGVYWRDYGVALGTLKGTYSGSSLILVPNNDSYKWTNPKTGDEVDDIQTPQDIIDKILTVFEPYQNGLNTEVLPNNEGIVVPQGLAVTAVMYDPEDEIDKTYYFAYDYNKKADESYVGWTLIQTIESGVNNFSDVKVQSFVYDNDFQLSRNGVELLNIVLQGTKNGLSRLNAPWIKEGYKNFNADTHDDSQLPLLEITENIEFEKENSLMQGSSKYKIENLIEVIVNGEDISKNTEREVNINNNNISFKDSSENNSINGVITYQYRGLKKNNLLKAINTAEAAKKEIQISEDGTDIDSSQQWVSADIMNNFNSELEEAKDFYKTATIQLDIDNATTVLNAATIEFNNAKQNGKLIIHTVAEKPIWGGSGQGMTWFTTTYPINNVEIIATNKNDIYSSEIVLRSLLGENEFLVNGMTSKQNTQDYWIIYTTQDSSLNDIPKEEMIVINEISEDFGMPQNQLHAWGTTDFEINQLISVVDENNTEAAPRMIGTDKHQIYVYTAYEAPFSVIYSTLESYQEQ